MDEPSLRLLRSAGDTDPSSHPHHPVCDLGQVLHLSKHSASVQVSKMTENEGASFLPWPAED